jgi:hypothetical protein
MCSLPYETSVATVLGGFGFFGVQDEGIALFSTVQVHHYLIHLLLFLPRTYILLLKLFLWWKLAHLLLKHKLLHLLLCRPVLLLVWILRNLLMNMIFNGLGYFYCIGNACDSNLCIGTTTKNVMIQPTVISVFALWSTQIFSLHRAPVLSTKMIKRYRLCPLTFRIQLSSHLSTSKATLPYSYSSKKLHFFYFASSPIFYEEIPFLAWNRARHLLFGSCWWGLGIVLFAIFCPKELH